MGGERVRGERCAQRGEAEGVTGVKKIMGVRRILPFDKGDGRRGERVNWGEGIICQVIVYQAIICQGII